jgi:hypothetical protein
VWQDFDFSLSSKFCMGSIPITYMYFHRLCVAAVAAHELSNLLHWYLIVEWQDPTFSNRYSVTHQKLVTALLQVRKEKISCFCLRTPSKMSGACSKLRRKGMPRPSLGANASELRGNWLTVIQVGIRKPAPCFDSVRSGSFRRCLSNALKLCFAGTQSDSCLRQNSSLVVCMEP